MSGTVDGDELVRGLAAVVGYTAAEESRPVLTAVCLALTDPMEVVGADGFRLAVQPLRTGLAQAMGQRALVPREAVRVLAQLWKAAPAPVEQPEGASIAELAVARRPIWLDCEMAERRLWLRWGDLTVAVQLLAGTYPNYSQLIPTRHTSRLTFHGPQLLRAVKQVAGMARDGSGIVRLRWEQGRVAVSAAADEMGNVETEAPVQLEGEPGKIAFSSKYLLEYLTGKDGVVALELNAPENPGTFRYRNGTVVVMPMFVRHEEPPTAKTEDEPPKPAPEPQTVAAAPAEPPAPPPEGEQKAGQPQEQAPAQDEATEKKARARKKRRAKRDK